MPRAAFTKTAIGRMLDASPQPSYLLDAKRRILFANNAVAEWLGVELDALYRVQCNYHSESRPSEALTSPAGKIAIEEEIAALASSLCPPPSCFEGVCSTSTVYPSASGSASSARRAHHIPVFDADGQVQGVLTVFELQPANGLAESQNPITPSELHASIAQLRVQYREVFTLDGLVGSSPLMKRVRERVEVLGSPQAKTTRVMVTGPQGVGKEFVARTIHQLRHQNQAPKDASIVPLRCELLDAETIGSTLTSFVKRCAEVEANQTPTLLLLHVDQLDAAAQAELQGFLAIEEIGIRTISTAASEYSDLRQTDDFRADLAETLATFEISVPPVSERAEDIPELIQYYLEAFNSQGGPQRSGFSPASLEQCFAYPWPGNIAEIRDVVFQCAAVAENSMIEVDELPPQIRLGMDAVIYPAESSDPIDLEKMLTEFERDLISKTLASVKQNKAEAARRLGLNRAKLLRRIAHLGLD